MCFRSDDPDPTQQPIRITRSDEAHGSESFADVSHLPSTRTRTNSSAHRPISHPAPASHGDKDKDTDKPTSQTHKKSPSSTADSKFLRKIKANDKDIANKMAMRPPDFIGAAGGF